MSMDWNEGKFPGPRAREREEWQPGRKPYKPDDNADLANNDEQTAVQTSDVSDMADASFWNDRKFPGPAARERADWQPDVASSESGEENASPAGKYSAPAHEDVIIAAEAHKISSSVDVTRGGDVHPGSVTFHEKDAGALQFRQAGRLVDDIVLKRYLSHLSDMEIEPLPEELKDVSSIRFFRITEMVYQKDEPAVPKFASVFNSVQNLNCGVFLLADSDGECTEFYMGIRAMDGERTSYSLEHTLRNTLAGQFPGIKTGDMHEQDIAGIMREIESQKNIASVSCIAQDKSRVTEIEGGFVQGLEKFVQAMRGQQYMMLVLARSASSRQLAAVRSAYEDIYSGLSPFANMQVSYGSSQADTISKSLSIGMSETESHSLTRSSQWSETKGDSLGESHSITRQNRLQAGIKALGGAALGLGMGMATSLVAGPMGMIAGLLLGGFAPDSETAAVNHNESFSSTKGGSTSQTEGGSVTQSKTENTGTSRQTGQSRTIQLTRQNKTILDTLQRIDDQLKRLEQCESMGMWESAAYFLSQNAASAEMAAGAWRSLMVGEKSGLETSAINMWTDGKDSRTAHLREYLANFIHPLFVYRSDNVNLPVTAASLVSGRELALEMGLPRNSTRGFPVIEHAEFALEPLRADGKMQGDSFIIGKIYSMGSDTGVDLRLERESMTAHTFVCGSTGTGKTNVVLSLLSELALKQNVPFLVIEPAKGEYKHALHNRARVLGTNPQKFDQLLRINPFSFPAGIHVLEHLDRLVEVFNVAWPMYAAMPAVLKDAMERAYIAVGWDMEKSTNRFGQIFPNFHDLLEQINIVVESSAYSSDTRGDYIGALSTRVRSLTTGLNSLLFSGDGFSNAQLFDENVIVDLSRIGSTETKALIMGLLITRLTEYRMATVVPGQSLKHITVLEEAHNLLKRTSTEQVMDGSNILGKAVELIANSVAEMRSFGEAFIIVDQSPGMLDLSAIRNTNTKIILRLPDQMDRELAGKAAGLNDEQIDELARLGQGVAAVYQNNWIQPVLTHIKGFKAACSTYAPTGAATGSSRETLENAFNFSLQLLEPGCLDFDLSRLDPQRLPFPARIATQLAALLDEYRQAQANACQWQGDFDIAATIVAACATAMFPDLLPQKFLGIIYDARDMSSLDGKLFAFCRQLAPQASHEQIRGLIQSLFLNIIKNNPENHDLSAIFAMWREDNRSARNV